MHLIFIRHGDPDYKNDSVTQKGKREIEFFLNEQMLQISFLVERSRELLLKILLRVQIDDDPFVQRFEFVRDRCHRYGFPASSGAGKNINRGRFVPVCERSGYLGFHIGPIDDFHWRFAEGDIKWIKHT